MLIMGFFAEFVCCTVQYPKDGCGAPLIIYITVKVSPFHGISITQETFLSILSKLDTTQEHSDYCLEDLFCILYLGRHHLALQVSLKFHH